MIRINNSLYKPEYFPDGTLRLRCDVKEDRVDLEWRFENNEELLVVYFLNKHLRDVCKVQEIHIYMPYIPNARMDRTKNKDEVFTLKYFAELINQMGFDSVKVVDPHSNVSLTLFDNLVNVDIFPTIKELAAKLLTDEKDIIFFPDEGAYKRYSVSMDNRYAYGIKKRDWRTGDIKGLDIKGDNLEEGFSVLIVDDICSYGGTFYHSAKKLREMGANKIWLYITHCENSILDGELIKSGLVDMIYTTDSIYKKEHELIKVIDVI